MNLHTRIGARIHELRQVRGLTQQELAARAGLDPATFSKIESGRRNVTVDTLHLLLAALEVSPQHFFAADSFREVPTRGPHRTPAVDSEALTLEETATGLRLHFPCGKFDAQVDFRGMKRDVVANAVLTLRNGLHQAELVSGGTGLEETALMSGAIAEAFLSVVYAYPGVNPSDIWRYIIYRAFIDPLNHPASSHRKDFGQGWKRTSGWALEQVLARHYGKFLAKHGVSITSLRSNLERVPFIELMGLTERVVPDKVDQFLLGQAKGKTVPIGVLHVKASLAERRTDDIPASRTIKDAGYLSIFVTMDAKDTPSERPINRGEYGRPGPQASDKRKDVEVDGNFSAVFSFNTNTTESPVQTPSGCRIVTVDFSDPNDKFTRYILNKWQQIRRHPG